MEHYPTIWFRSTSVLRVQNVEYLVRGELTIKGVTLAVSLDVRYEGQIDDASSAGNSRAGFTAQTALSRQEFSIMSDPLPHTGDALVGDTIKAIIHVQAVREG